MAHGFAQAPVQTPVAAILQNYKPVTAERLKKPEDGDWLMVRRTYDGWGYSPLDQITPANVTRLQPVWVFATGVTNGHEAPPIVNNGVMFVATPGNQVIAIDAKTGAALAIPPAAARGRRSCCTRPAAASRCWRQSVLRRGRSGAGRARRPDGQAKSGPRRSPKTTKGYYMSLAPLVADGKVMVGTSGGELGVRGFVAAYDVETGKEAWRAFTVPAPGEPGSETWPNGDQWKTGGGSVWVTGNYDPETNLAFWGTGNGGPWMGDQRPGDNLYTPRRRSRSMSRPARSKVTTSTIPNESWDWDEVSPPILVDYKRNGKTIKGLIDVARDGYLWFLERTDGPINFVEGTPFVKQNVFESLDPEDRAAGRRSRPQARHRQDGRFLPVALGRQELAADRVQPEDADDLHPRQRESVRHIHRGEADLHGGRAATPARRPRSISRPAPTTSAKCRRGTSTPASASGPTTTRSLQNWGPMLATGGGLVFSGGTNDRMFHAFDASSGKLLWEFPTNSGITGQPSSFMVDGKQYIAVQSGWGVDARGMQTRLNSVSPGNFPEVPEGGAVWVFAVK